jgi:hypothetical protein
MCHYLCGEPLCQLVNKMPTSSSQFPEGSWLTCWVGVIFFSCVWGGASNLTTVSGDLITCRSLWVCASSVA